jgi:hypothetical protein
VADQHRIRAQLVLSSSQRVVSRGASARFEIRSLTNLYVFHAKSCAGTRRCLLNEYCFVVCARAQPVIDVYRGDIVTTRAREGQKSERIRTAATCDDDARVAREVVEADQSRQQPIA